MIAEPSDSCMHLIQCGICLALLSHSLCVLLLFALLFLRMTQALRGGSTGEKAGLAGSSMRENKIHLSRPAGKCCKPNRTKEQILVIFDAVYALLSEHQTSTIYTRIISNNMFP